MTNATSGPRPSRVRSPSASRPSRKRTNAILCVGVAANVARDFPPEMQLREVTLAGNHVILEPLRLAHANELWPDAVEPGLFQHLAPGLESSKVVMLVWTARRLEEKATGIAIPLLQRDAVTKRAFG